MKTSRYFVARFIENLARGEAKNVGVFYMTDEGISARFLGEKGTGTVDLRTVRSLIPHTPTYKQWIDYWRALLAEKSEPTEQIGEIVRSAKGNFVVEEGSGVFIPPQAAVDGAHRLDYLFHLLVDEFPRVDNADDVQRGLSERCEQIVRRYQLRKDPHFSESPSISIQVDGSTKHVRPSYHWLNGRDVYYQKVLIDDVKFDLTQRDVTSARWLFERLKELSGSVETKALVKFAERDETNKSSRDEYVEILSSVVDNIIDVDNENEVDREFGQLVATH
jgi:hypothetical protein